MDYILKEYIRKLLMTSYDRNSLNIKIPMVYTVTYKELLQYINSIVPCKVCEDHVNMHDLTYNYVVTF